MNEVTDIEARFLGYLRSLGFAQESIVYEPRLSNSSSTSYIPDFAILHPESKEPLAVIEVKPAHGPESLQRGVERIDEYVRSIKGRAVRGFVACPLTLGDGFEFYVSSDGRPKQVPSTTFLSVSSLSSAVFAETKERVEEQKKFAVDSFTKTCKWAAVFVVIVALADVVLSFFGFSLLTAERMALICAGVFLFVLPYAQKFKWLGLEWERFVTSHKG